MRLIACLIAVITLWGGTAHSNSVLSWVSLKSTEGGTLSACIGDGSTDDTACIQAHTDYAFTHNLNAVYCPAGNYKTSSPLYIDPPNNLRSNLAVPTQFQFTMAFFGDPKGSGALPLASQPTCQIRPTFNDDVAVYVGPGQGMVVENVAVIGPDNSTYRGNLPVGGVGIGIAGGSGGASNTLLRNTFVRYFRDLYMTDANGGCCLSDSNAFEHVGGMDGYIGIRLFGTQSFINNIIEPTFYNVTNAIDDTYSHQTQIIGGNLSSNESASAAFTISGASASNCGAYSLCLTVTVASPDAKIPNVYDSFEVLTTHFGLIPFSMTSWNSSTHVMVLQALDTWEMTNYGNNDYWDNSVIYTELNAATTLYASERLRVVKGVGFELDGAHIENDAACTTLADVTSVWAGQASSEIRNPFFNYNTSLPGNATLANKYCQQAWPFINNTGSSDYSLKISGGNWNPTEAAVSYSLLFDSDPYARISGSQLNGSAIFNFRLKATAGASGRSYGQIDATDYQLATVARGIGFWDNDYWLPSQRGGVPGFAGAFQWQLGELTSPFCGYEPCSSVTPNLSPTLYSLVSGTLGALGTYPPIACRTVFKSVDWDTTTVTPPSTVGGGIFRRSASCPGWSWGQNLTDATVGHTVTWSYSRGSSDLYLDANTINWMFNGLGFTLNNGEGAQPYVVTGVYPYLGYVSVIWAGNNTGNAGGNSVGLQGGTDQVYSCTASCTIGQAAYSWASY